MTTQDLDRLADELARYSRTDELPLLTAQRPELTLDDAYYIQRRCAELREGDGDPVVGRKVAMVSPERQRANGATEPVAGRLFESGRVQNGGDVREVAGERARVECELALVLADDLRGPGTTEDDVIAATSAILPAFEIVERRSAPDAGIPDRIAVNASFAGFVLGTNDVDPRSVDRVDTEVEFELDGEVVAIGALGAVLGDPARSVVWLADRLASLGEGLRAGDVILTGTIVSPVAASRAGTFRATFGGGLGSVQMTGLGPEPPA